MDNWVNVADLIQSTRHMYALRMFQGYYCELSIEAIPCPLSPCYHIVEYHAGGTAIASDSAGEQ
jgi:hypothetical protein